MLFLLWEPSFILKSYRVVGWVAHKILVSAQGPLVLGLGQKGLGLRGLGPGLDNNVKVFKSLGFL